MCVRILHIPNDCSATEHLRFLVWGGVRATASKLSPKTPRVHGRRRLGLQNLFNYSGRGTYNQATPGLLNACKCEHAEISQDFDQFSATEDVIVHLATFGSPQRDSTRFGGK